MPPKPPQPIMDRHTYLPPHVQHAMEQQMQQTLPAHLKQYTDGNSYIPKHAEKAIADHMEKVMPGQFKKYAAPYVQQKVMSQHIAIAGATAQSVPGPTGPGSAPHPVAQGHFQPAPEQPQPVPLPAPAPLYPSGQAPVPTEQPSTYDFIVNPDAQPAKRRLLPVGNSARGRAAFIAGGLVILLIVFLVIKSLISGSSGLTSFVTIAQDQQELIHLATNATQQPGLTTTNQNFAATADLSLGSAQSAIIRYLAANGQKVNSKTLSLKVSSTVDSQLTAAAAATIYDQTFQQITASKLTAYVNDLRQTYQQTKGKQGRILLSNDFKQAQLLLTQVNTAPAGQ